MDGNSPYAIPVNRRLSTVKEAFDWLMPNLVRKAIEQGLDVKRQGDWFFFPADKPPKVCDYGSQHYGIVTFKLYENHQLNYGGVQTRHVGEQVVYKHMLRLAYPAPFVRGDVTAPDHPTLHLGDWHIGVRTRSTPAGSRDGPGLD